MPHTALAKCATQSQKPLNSPSFAFELMPVIASARACHHGDKPNTICHQKFIMMPNKQYQNILLQLQLQQQQQQVVRLLMQGHIKGEGCSQGSM